MNLLLIGDTQLGSGSTLGRTLEEQDALLDRVAQIAADEDVALVVHLGDVFESRSPTRDQDEAFARFLVHVSRGAQVLIVGGNHCWRGFERASTVGLFREMGVQVALTPDVYLFGDVAVAALPWVAPGRLVASRNGAGRDQVNVEAAELLVRTATGLWERAQVGLDRAILAGHWAVTGASLPTGLPVEMLHEPVLPLTDLLDQGWDALAFAHIHKAQTMSAEPPAFYVGSPWTNDWGEAGLEHGVTILDTDTMERRFVAVDDTPFVTIENDLVPWGEPPGIVASMIPEGFEIPDGAVVRLRYTATADQARRIDQGKIREALHAAGASRVFLQPTIVREARARVEGVDEHLGPLEALHLYVRHHEIPVARAHAMGERTTRYLETSA